jgi:hypothetical protein
MASANTHNNYEQVYNASESPNLLAKASRTICVLMPRGVWAAAFSDENELLTIHYTGYSKNKPVWQLDFFEHLFGTEPIFADKNNVAGVFLCTAKNLLVPEELYSENEAKSWLHALHFVEPSEDVQAYSLLEQDARYVLAIPRNITELIRINFRNAETLPLALYQFKGVDTAKFKAYCCITPEHVCTTLHGDGKLLWHRITEYTNGEGAAFNIKHYCRENNIDESQLEVICNSMLASEYDAINGLSLQFRGVWDGSNERPKSRWQPSISLAKQLLACV